MNRTLPFRLSSSTLVAAVALWGLAACGESATPAGQADAVPDAITAPDLLPAPADGAVEADAPDASDDDTSGPAPGQLGDACDEAGDCASGWCVPSAEGTVCSRTCFADCPDGWSCRSVENPVGDPIFICVDVTANLCHPCREDADCNKGLGGTANRCLPFGEDGSFCGLACGDGTGSCPAGYSCQAVGDGGDEAPTQCVPDTGECACNDLAKKLALTTDCSVSNDLGTCSGTRGCGAGGLTACGAPTPIEEVCNGADDDCDGEPDEGLGGEACEVTNGFGSCAGVTTCAGGDFVCTGQEAIAELCNQEDDDCDGEIDEGFPDDDEDGTLDCVDADDDDDGWSDGEDCAPLEATVNPGAQEHCNGLDDDCDGKIDEDGAEGCTPFYKDVDQDGFGDDASPALCLCAPQGEAFYTALQGGDCDDERVTAKPGAPEQCNDLDDDCDGETDEGADVDTDGDGLSNCTDPDDDDDGWPDDEDCAPLVKLIHPGAPEACDGVDTDCDGVKDEPGAAGCTDHWRDKDGDGQGDEGSEPQCLCGPDGTTLHTATEAGDCDDLSPQVFDGAPEQCNGVDDDCDGETDEGATGDTDGDGLDDCVDPDDDGDGSPDEEDCAPLDATRYPGADEACNDVDDDCDGLVDEQGAEGCEDRWIDADGDGFGALGSAPRCFCDEDPTGVYTAAGATDCDDGSTAVKPDGQESCNGVDDDCDGDTDEGQLSPCGDCSTTCVLETGEETEEPWEATPDNSSGLEPSPDGGLTLSSQTFAQPFIWIANSVENTVSKLNTDTGDEVARYQVCANPSRTAVDLDGNGIISCRDDGRIAKIAVLEPDCADKDGDGTLETSRDEDGDGVISVDEMVTDDECVLWVTQPDGPETDSGCGGDTGCARAAGVDAHNDVWVGMYASSRLARLDGQTGEELLSLPLTCRPYGLGIDGDGTIWVVCRTNGHILVKVDPVEGQVATYPHPSDYVYGMAIDPFGRIWVAGGEAGTVARFDPVSETWTEVTGLDPGYSRGVAVRLDLDAQDQVVGAKVYVAHHTWTGGCGENAGEHRMVSVVDAETAEVLPSVDLGADRAPVGVAIDSLGFLWSINQCESTATKIDPVTREIVGSYPVGLSPYTYSDMTGYALKTVTTSQGFYRKVFTGWVGAQTVWDQLFVTADLPGDGVTWVRVSWRTAETEADLSSQPWQGPAGPFPPATFPLKLDTTGHFLEVRLSMGTNDPDLKPRVDSLSVVAHQE